MTLTSHVSMSTPKADGYMTQLSKHFAHKIKVERTGNAVVFHFSAGTVQALAEGDLLTLSAQAKTAEHLHEVENIVGSHLERFAFRENLRVTWPGETGVE